MALLQKIRNFFIPRHMVKPELVCGEIPSTKEIYGTAFRIAWPSTLEAVLVGLVGVIDTIMVSTLGSGAIAAVGLTNQPKMIVLAIIIAGVAGIAGIAGPCRNSWHPHHGEGSAAGGYLRTDRDTAGCRKWKRSSCYPARYR